MKSSIQSLNLSAASAEEVEGIAAKSRAERAAGDREELCGSINGTVDGQH